LRGILLIIIIINVENSCVALEETEMLVSVFSFYYVYFI